MREHLGIFRGFSPDEKGDSEIIVNGEKIKGKWVQGFYSIDTICGGCGTKLVSVIRKVPTQVYDYESFVVLPETVGECTGLTDKNGKLIFEGDILNALMPLPFEGDITDTGYVMWDTEKTQYIVMTENNSKYSLIWENGIIGNIYEQPELLGGDSE